MNPNYQNFQFTQALAAQPRAAQDYIS